WRGGGGGFLGDFAATPANDASVVGAYSTDGTTSIDPPRKPFVVPANVALDGVETTVDDGIFQFASLSVPPGVRLRFEGSKPARIFVRGSATIEGVLDAAGVDGSRAATLDDKALFSGTNTPCNASTNAFDKIPVFPQAPKGKKGGRSGPLGGIGGNGGDL